jgi:hypothetical protein
MLTQFGRDHTFEFHGALCRLLKHLNASLMEKRQFNIKNKKDARRSEGQSINQSIITLQRTMSDPICVLLARRTGR